MNQPTMNGLTIFVVEDDEWYREYLTYTLSLNPDHHVFAFADGKQCLDKLDQCPDVVTIDFSLPDMTGGELMKKIHSRCQDTEFIIISEQDKIETAVELLRDGAFDYFVKSRDIRDRLLHSIAHIRERLHLKERVTQLEKAIGEKFDDFRKNIIGRSPTMQQVFGLMEKSLHNQLTVMVTGETGTGKEEVARAIHFNSMFRKGPFVAVNVAAIPRELAESELFGHEKGAFTGAVASRKGKFEEADGGTLFLDEIGEMSLDLQVKLLRVLQDKMVTRVGGNHPVKVNNRIIVATHRNLREEVDKGNFREDLFYRLYGLTIHLPPLRERGSDVLLLAIHFINRFCNENQMSVKTLSEEAATQLKNYAFPGNVRELKSMVELACVLSAGDEISPADIRFPGTTPVTGFYESHLTLDDYMRKIIRHYLDINDQNVVLTAEQLGIGKSTIYRMMKDDKGL